MDKAIKNNRWLVLLAKIILLAAVLYFFYRQFQRIDPDQLKQTYPQVYWPIGLCLLLVFVNWFFEYLKWSSSVDFVVPGSTRKIKTHSFLAGILTGFVTPNLWGNFIGRIFYFEAEKRPVLIGITLFSNAAQFLASMLFGLVSFYLLGLREGQALFHDFWFLLSAALVFAVLLFLYLFLRNFPDFIQRWQWLKQFAVSFKAPIDLRLKLLSYSLLRHVVFSVQFVLLLAAFGSSLSVTNLFLVWKIYFWSTLIPSIWFGKLVIRESVALWIFGLYTGEVEAVLMASILLWLLNQGLTALVGIPFVKYRNKAL